MTSGRLDRLGPAASRARALAGPARSAGGTASSALRRVLRDPVALRDAERARLAADATAALRRSGVGPAASGALDAALVAWLADPCSRTGALLTAAEGRYRADATAPVPAGTADLPLDEAQLLARRLAHAGRPA